MQPSVPGLHNKIAKMCFSFNIIEKIIEIYEETKKANKRFANTEAVSLIEKK